MLDMTDDEMLEQMQQHRYPYFIDNESAESWAVNLETGNFLIMIYPIGDDYHIDHIKNCRKILIELYDRGKAPTPTGIRPIADIRFKNKPWAQGFILHSTKAPMGCCSLEEMFEIIRYCARLSGLMAFL
jgi:hypothetical protein